MIQSMELPLVVFTVLSQLAIGLALMDVLRTTGIWSVSPPALRRQWLVASAVMALGLLVSLTHLGNPLGAPRAITHLSTAWLSREVLLFGLLVILMGATALKGASRPLVWMSASVGLAGLVVQGMVYSPPAFPALNNAVPFALFLITAATLGAAAATWFAPAEGQPVLKTTLVSALCAGLILVLVVPCVWASGGTVMRETAAAYAASPLYWLYAVLGLALPLAVVLRLRRIPSWVPLVILAGAICGRIVFYLDTVHTASNLGGLY
jgi:DMSO reductase anchor subunit